MTVSPLELTVSAQSAKPKLMKVPSDTDLERIRTQNSERHTGKRLKTIVFSLCVAQFLSALDITIVATALPTIANQLGATTAEYTWVSSSYTLASTASTPLWAKFSDIWGRKPLLLIANAVFMGGSLVAGLSQSPDMLIAGRTLQGLGGGGLGIICQIIIADLFSIELRAKYYGLSALVYSVASGLGPILGGIFTQTIGWKWCFFINLPLDAISLVLLFFTLNLEIPQTTIIEGLRDFDWIGSAAIIGGTICFLCGLEGGASQEHSWSSAYTLCLMLSGIALLGFFCFYEWRFAISPLVPMRIFTGRSRIAAVSTGCIHSFVFISYDFFLPLYFQVVLGASPIHSGLWLLTLIVPMSTLAALTGIFIKKTGNFQIPAWAGSILMTLGTGLFISFKPTIEWAKIIIYQLIAGIGAGPVFLSPMIALQNHLQPEDISPGISAFTFLRSIFTSISIVVGGVVLQKGLGGGSLTSSSEERMGRRATSTQISAQQAQEYIFALQNLWIFYTAFCGVMFLSGLLIGKKPTTNSKADVSEDYQASETADELGKATKSEEKQ